MKSLFIWMTKFCVLTFFYCECFLYVGSALLSGSSSALADGGAGSFMLGFVLLFGVMASFLSVFLLKKIERKFPDIVWQIAFVLGMINSSAFIAMLLPPQVFIAVNGKVLLATYFFLTLALLAVIRFLNIERKIRLLIYLLPIVVASSTYLIMIMIWTPH